MKKIQTFGKRSSSLALRGRLMDPVSIRSKGHESCIPVEFSWEVSQGVLRVYWLHKRLHKRPADGIPDSQNRFDFDTEAIHRFRVSPKCEFPALQLYFAFFHQTFSIQLSLTLLSSFQLFICVPHLCARCNIDSLQCSFEF